MCVQDYGEVHWKEGELEDKDIAYTSGHSHAGVLFSVGGQCAAIVLEMHFIIVIFERNFIDHNI